MDSRPPTLSARARAVLGEVGHVLADAEARGQPWEFELQPGMVGTRVPAGPARRFDGSFRIVITTLPLLAVIEQSPDVPERPG